ncbi:MAG TPA: vitamin K epoxide reductase family protein [Verrucomicrobiae bacterium]|nr:vitamin K epoxide reductase family protein [Verrucomicrobiae bacterium]
MGEKRPVVYNHSSEAGISGRSFLWAGRCCLALAACGALYLAIVSLSRGGVAGCGPGSGCDRVISSRWAYWLGLPVSLPACALYVLFLVLSFPAARPRIRPSRLWPTVVVGLSGMIVGAVIWFFLLQALVVRAWCKYCLATHAFALAGAGLLLLALAKVRSDRLTDNSQRTASPCSRQVLDCASPLALCRAQVLSLLKSLRPDKGDLRLGLLVAVSGLAVLVGGQLAFRKGLYEVTSLGGARASVTEIVLYDGRFRLNASELPRIGPSTATNFIVSLFDYTCSHCRQEQPILKAVIEKYGGTVAIIELPVPLDAECNPSLLMTAPANHDACAYAKLGLALWRARPDAFPAFQDWCMSSPETPALAVVRAKAESIVGKDALERALADPWVGRQLHSDIALYTANGQVNGDGRLPQLVIGDVVTHGEVARAADLDLLIQQHVLKPKHATRN